MSTRIAAVVIAASLCAAALSCAAASSPIPWHDDYLTALESASGKMLLVWFCDSTAGANNARFEAEVLLDKQIAAAIEQRYAMLKLPLDATVESEAGPISILKHPAFAELMGRPGLAILDLVDGLPERTVASVFPFTRGPITAEKLAVLLDLPRGTLTQRTLIYAVRTHANGPASADSHLSPLLLREAASHAQHQASITLQGHHNWERRFQAINAQLPARLVSYEVCAESWPGQDLVSAAEECVDSWHQSPGHWDLVSRRHILFGYDMHRGANGTWYATGIFAR